MFLRSGYGAAAAAGRWLARTAAMGKSIGRKRRAAQGARSRLRPVVGRAAGVLALLGTTVTVVVFSGAPAQALVSANSIVTWNMQGATSGGANNWVDQVAGMAADHNVVVLQEAGAIPAAATPTTYTHTINDGPTTYTLREYRWNGYWVYHMQVDGDAAGTRTNMAIVTHAEATATYVIRPQGDVRTDGSHAGRPSIGVRIPDEHGDGRSVIWDVHAQAFGAQGALHNDATAILEQIDRVMNGAAVGGLPPSWAAVGDFNRDPDTQMAPDLMGTGWGDDLHVIYADEYTHFNLDTGQNAELDFMVTNDDTAGLSARVPGGALSDHAPVEFGMHMEAAASQSQIALRGSADECLDAAASSNGTIRENTQLILSGCNTTATETWQFNADGTITDRGWCMDVYTLLTNPDGVQVDLWACNGTANQKFRALTDGTIYNPATGKCLDTTPPTIHQGPPPPAPAAGMSLRACNGSLPSQAWNDDPPYLQPPAGQTSGSGQTSVYLASAAYPDKILCASRSDNAVWLEPVVTRADPYCQWQQIGQQSAFVLYNPQKHQNMVYTGPGARIVMMDPHWDRGYFAWAGSGLRPYASNDQYLAAEAPGRPGTPVNGPVGTKTWDGALSPMLSWNAIPVPVVTGLDRAIATLAFNASAGNAPSPAYIGLTIIRSYYWPNQVLCADPSDQWVHLRDRPQDDPYCEWQLIGTWDKFVAYNPVKGQAMAYEGGDGGPLVMENVAFPTGNNQYFSWGAQETWGAMALRSFLDDGQNVDAAPNGIPRTDPVRTRSWRHGDQKPLTWDIDSPNAYPYMLPQGTDCTPTSIAAAVNQKYVSAQLDYSGNSSGMLRAHNTAPPGPWEWYDLCRTTTAHAYAIRSVGNNQFVSTETGYIGSQYAMLRARSSTITSQERYALSPVGSGIYSIRSAANSNFVTAQIDYTDPNYAELRAQAIGVGPWELFQ